MTGQLSLLLEQTDPRGVVLFIFLIACGIGAFIAYRRYTALVVAPDKIVVLREDRTRRIKKVLHAGERYRPHKQSGDDWDEEYSLLPSTHMIGKYAVTWKLVVSQIDRFLNAPPMMRFPEHLSGVPIGIQNLRHMLLENPDLDFSRYADEYGLEIVAIDPPLGSIKKPEGAVLGLCTCHNETVTLSYEDREQHVYLTGKTKSGKSTLLLNMAIADIRAGKGVAFLDPHGDTARDLLALVPRNRAEDVIFISGDHPVPISIMEARSDGEREILSDDIYTLLRGMSDTWGERMDAILTNTLAALFTAKHCSFLDIYHFLADEDFRQEVLSRVDNPAILRFWANYRPPNYPRGSEQPILSRMEKFITRPTLSAILGSESGIDMSDVIQSGKILIVDTSRHSMGEHTGAVLGGLIVTKIYQATMRRAAIPKAKRTPFYLYLDEFQKYIATNIESFLSETRKYGTSVTLAHQYLAQIPDSARHAIFGNVGTFFFFRLGYSDARHAQNELGRWTAEDIVNLSTDAHEALLRPVKGAAFTSKIRTLPPPKRGEDLSDDILSRQPRPSAPPPVAADDDDEVRPGVVPPDDED